MKKWKITVTVLAFLLLLCRPMEQVSAAGAIGDINNFNSLQGTAKYLGNQYRDNYYLDMEETGLLEAGYAAINGIANILFSFIRWLAYLTVTVFYICFNLNLADLFGSQIDTIQSALNDSIFEPLFLLGCALTSCVLIVRMLRQDMMGALGQLAKIIGIVMLSILAVTQSATVLTYCTNITKDISIQILSGVNGANGMEQNVEDFAAQGAGILWSNLVHEPWITLEFGTDQASEEDIELFLITSPGNEDARKALVEDRDWKCFSMKRGGERIGFLILYLIPFLMKCAIYLLIALIQLTFQLLAIFYIFMAPLILILSLVPGYEGMLGTWLRKILESQVSILIITMMIGILVKFDQIIFEWARTNSYGWMIALVIQVALAFALFLNRDKILTLMSNIQRGVANPRLARTRLKMGGNLYQKEIPNAIKYAGKAGKIAGKGVKKLDPMGAIKNLGDRKAQFYRDYYSEDQKKEKGGGRTGKSRSAEKSNAAKERSVIRLEGKQEAGRLITGTRRKETNRLPGPTRVKGENTLPGPVENQQVISLPGPVKVRRTSALPGPVENKPAIAMQEPVKARPVFMLSGPVDEKHTPLQSGTVRARPSITLSGAAEERQTTVRTEENYLRNVTVSSGREEDKDTAVHPEPEKIRPAFIRSVPAGDKDSTIRSGAEESISVSAQQKAKEIRHVTQPQTAGKNPNPRFLAGSESVEKKGQAGGENTSRLAETSKIARMKQPERLPRLERIRKTSCGPEGAAIIKYAETHKEVKNQLCEASVFSEQSTEGQKLPPEVTAPSENDQEGNRPKLTAIRKSEQFAARNKGRMLHHQKELQNVKKTGKDHGTSEMAPKLKKPVIINWEQSQEQEEKKPVYNFNVEGRKEAAETGNSQLPVLMDYVENTSVKNSKQEETLHNSGAGTNQSAIRKPIRKAAVEYPESPKIQKQVLRRKKQVQDNVIRRNKKESLMLQAKNDYHGISVSDRRIPDNLGKNHIVSKGHSGKKST